jgi:c-di-GMP-binding flagellar brake protein YcgR
MRFYKIYKRNVQIQHWNIDNNNQNKLIRFVFRIETKLMAAFHT